MQQSEEESSKEMASETKLQFSTSYATASASSEGSLVEDKDFAAIHDEDLLRKMWQQTEDFNMKKKIRGRMYKLREQRLREFYTSGEVLGDILNQAIPQGEYREHMEFEADDGNGMEVSYSMGGRLSMSSSTSSIDRKRGLEMEGESPEKRERKKSGDAQVITEKMHRKKSGDAQVITENIQRKKSGDAQVITENIQRKKSADGQVITEKIQRKSIDRGQRLKQVQDGAGSGEGCTIVEVTTTQLSPEVTMSSQTKESSTSTSYTVHTSKTSGGTYTTMETSEVRDGSGPTIVEVTENRTTSPTQPAGDTYYQYQETHYEIPSRVTIEVVKEPQIVEIESTRTVDTKDRRESKESKVVETVSEITESKSTTEKQTCPGTGVVEKQPIITHPPEVVDKRRFSEIYRPFTIACSVPDKSPRAVSPKSRLPRVSGKKPIDDSPAAIQTTVKITETPKKKQQVTKRSKSDEVPKPRYQSAPARRSPEPHPHVGRSAVVHVRVPAGRTKVPSEVERKMEDSIMEELGRLDTFLSQRGEKMKVIGMDYESKVRQRQSKKQTKPISHDKPGERRTKETTEIRKEVTCTTELQQATPSEDVADKSPNSQVPEQEVPDYAEEGRVPVVEPPLKKRHMYTVGVDEVDNDKSTGDTTRPYDDIVSMEEEIIDVSEISKERKVKPIQKVPDILSRPTRLGRKDKPTATILVTTKPRDEVTVTIRKKQLEGRTSSDKSIRDRVQPVTKRVQSDTALKPGQRTKPSYVSPVKHEVVSTRDVKRPAAGKPSQPTAVTRGRTPPTGYRHDSSPKYSPTTSPRRSPERDVKYPSRTSPPGSPGRDDSKLKYIPGRSSPSRSSPIRDTKIPFRSREGTPKSPERSFKGPSTKLPDKDDRARPKPSATAAGGRPSARPTIPTYGRNVPSFPQRPTGVIQNGTSSPETSSPPRASPTRDIHEPESPRMSPVLGVDEAYDREPQEYPSEDLITHDTDEYKKEEALKEYIMTSKVTTVTSRIDTTDDIEDTKRHPVPHGTDVSGPKSKVTTTWPERKEPDTRKKVLSDDRKPSKEKIVPGELVKPSRESPRGTTKTPKFAREATPTPKPKDVKPGRKLSDEKSPVKPGRTDSSSSLRREKAQRGKPDIPKKEATVKPDREAPCWKTEKEKIEPKIHELVEDVSEYRKEIVCDREMESVDKKVVNTEESLKFRMQYPDGESDTDTPLYETSKASYVTTLTTSQEMRELQKHPIKDVSTLEDDVPLAESDGDTPGSVRKRKELFETIGTSTPRRPLPRESDEISSKVSQKSAYFEAKAKGEYVPESDEEMQPSDEEEKHDDGRYATSETVLSQTTYSKDYSVEDWPEEREKPQHGIKKSSIYTNVPEEPKSDNIPTERDITEDRKPWGTRPEEESPSRPTHGKPWAVLPRDKRPQSPENWNKSPRVSPDKTRIETRRRSSPERKDRQPEEKSPDRSKPWLQGRGRRPASPESTKEKPEKPNKPGPRDRTYDKPWARTTGREEPTIKNKPKDRDSERPQSPFRRNVLTEGSPGRTSATRPQSRRPESPVLDKPKGEKSVRTYDKPWSVQPKDRPPVTKSIDDFPVKITDENWIRSREATPERPSVYGKDRTPDYYRPRSVSPSFDEPESKWRRSPKSPSSGKGSPRATPEREGYGGIQDSSSRFRPEKTRSPSPEEERKQPTVVRRTSSKGLIGAKVEAFVSKVEKSSQKSLFKSELENYDTKIEDIEDLELLETMLERAKSYDDRRRIRAQIRLIRRKLYPEGDGTTITTSVLLPSRTHETPYSPEVPRKSRFSPVTTRKVSPESNRHRPEEFPPYSPKTRDYPETRASPDTPRRPPSPKPVRQYSPDARRPSSPVLRQPTDARRPSSPTDIKKSSVYPETARSPYPDVSRRPISPEISLRRSPETSRKYPQSPESSQRRPSSPEASRRRPSSPEASQRRPSSPEQSRRRPSPPEASRRQPSSPEQSRRRPSSPEQTRRRPSSPEQNRRRPSSPEQTRRRPSSPDQSRRRPSSPEQSRRRPYSPDQSRRRPSSPDQSRRRPSSPEQSRRRPSSPDQSRRRPSSPDQSRRRPSSPEASRRRPFAPEHRRPSSPEAIRRRPSSPLAPAATSSPTPVDGVRVTRKGSGPYYSQSPSPSPPTSRKPSKGISPERGSSPRRSSRPDYIVETTSRKSSRTERTITTKGRAPIKEPSPTRKPYPEPQSPKGRSPATSMASAPTQRLPEQPRDTTDVTSSYGVGPTDENGMPLFGLSALRKKPTRDQPETYGLASTSLLLNGYSSKKRDSGPTDSSGKPLFGLQAITREHAPVRDKSPPVADDYPEESRYIITDRSQPLKTIIQSHENIVSKSYRNEWEGEPPESPTSVRKRSQPFQDIVHRHEEQVRRMSSSPPSSPTLKPKAKLRDTFLKNLPDEGSDFEDKPQDLKATRERSRALRDIIQRHEERTVREHRLASTTIRKSSSPSPPPSDDSTSAPRRSSAGLVKRRSPSPDMIHRGGSPQTMEVSDQTYYSSRRYREMSPPAYSDTSKVSMKRDVVRNETRVRSGEEPVTKTTRAEYRYKWPPEDEGVGHSTRKVTSSVEVGGQKVLEEEEEEEQPIKRTPSGFTRGRVGGGSVKALSKKFQEAGGSKATPSRTERTSPTRKKSPESPPPRRRTQSPGKSRVQPSVSMEVRCGSPGGSRSPSPPSKSFLEDRKPVTGVQDVVRRMRASDTVIREGESDSDREARSLLNKFLGAQVLMQGIEPILKSQRVHIDDDDDSAPLTGSANDKGSRMQKEVRSVRYGRSDDGGKTWDTKGYTASKVTMGDTVIINGVNINDVADDKFLREMLDQCEEYEDRRKIRARIKMITGGSRKDDESDSHSEEIRTIGKDVRRPSPGRDTSSSTSYSTSMQGRSETTTRTSSGRSPSQGDHQVKRSSYSVTSSQTTSSTSSTSKAGMQSRAPTSPFAKFKQMDEKSTQSSPSTPCTPQTPGGKSGPIFKFTDQGVSRSASGVKDMLLYWCQCRTRDYQNVKIENFSTSWNDGMAFCALIHHFYPEAFDFNSLNPKNRRRNFQLAFQVADEKAGIAPLLDVDDMVAMPKPDWKCVFTYVQSMYQKLKDQS